MKPPKKPLLIGFVTGISALYACKNGQQERLETANEALVLTIDGIGEEAKKYALSYRLYCDSTKEKVSEKLNSGTPTETVADSASLTGNSIEFSGEAVKKLSDDSICILDIYSDDTSAHDKFKWTLEDSEGTPVKGVFYITTPGTITKKTLSLTAFATFVDESDTFTVTIKTTYPKELAGKRVTASYLSCGSNKLNYAEANSDATVDSSTFTFAHKFNVNKSNFKDQDVDCSFTSEVDGLEYKSKGNLKLAKNPDGKPLDLSTDLELSKFDKNAETISAEISYQSGFCEMKPGINGCVPK